MGDFSIRPHSFFFYLTVMASVMWELAHYPNAYAFFLLG
jgi:hypothetical protein